MFVFTLDPALHIFIEFHVKTHQGLLYLAGTIYLECYDFIMLLYAQFSFILLNQFVPSCTVNKICPIVPKTWPYSETLLPLSTNEIQAWAFLGRQVVADRFYSTSVHF